MKNYIKPEAKVNSFACEDIITTSSAPSVPDVNPATLVKTGYSIGAIKSLFNN